MSGRELNGFVVTGVFAWVVCGLVARMTVGFPDLFWAFYFPLFLFVGYFGTLLVPPFVREVTKNRRYRSHRRQEGLLDAGHMVTWWIVLGSLTLSTVSVAYMTAGQFSQISLQKPIAVRSKRPGAESEYRVLLDSARRNRIQRRRAENTVERKAKQPEPMSRSVPPTTLPTDPTDSRPADGRGIDSAADNLAEPEANENQPIAVSLDQPFGDWGKALTRKNWTAFQVDMGMNLVNRGKHLETIAELTNVLRLNPGNVAALVKRSKSYRLIGEFNKAIVDASDAIERNPKCAEAYHNRGVAYAKLGQFAKAIDDYNKAIELKSNLQESHFGLGTARFHLGNFDQAILDLTEAIEIDPDFAKAYYNRGIAYYKKDQLGKAFADYTEALRHNSELPAW